MYLYSRLPAKVLYIKCMEENQNETHYVSGRMAENLQGLRPKDNKTATEPRNLPLESHSASLAAKRKLLCNGKERFKTSHTERLHMQLKRSVLRTGLWDLDGIWSLSRWRKWNNAFSSSALGWEMCLFSGLLRVPVDLLCLIIHNSSQAAERHFTLPENV